MSLLEPSPDHPVTRRLEHSRHRPRYHFLPPANWMNDPNGLIRWGDEYHLFYQYNPADAAWGGIHWGHAVSGDLVHWRDEVVALAPQPGTPDEDGCWSGCAVDDDGTPTLFYTGLRGDSARTGSQNVCVATGSADLKVWKKFGGNPVLEPPPHLPLTAFRDPSVWRQDGVWHLCIGAGIEGRGGAALLYRSENLRDWDYLGPLLVADEVADELVRADVWECPQLLEFGAKQVLLFSVLRRDETPRTRHSVALVGEFRNAKFDVETVQKLDHGDFHFYAPQTLRDRDGRHLVWGWVQEGRSAAAQRAAGWSGAMSLPRVVTLQRGGLHFSPARETETLRDTCLTLAGEQAVSGDQLEVVALFSPKYACGLTLSHGGTEQTRIVYDPARGCLSVDRARSSSDASGEPHTHPNEGALALQVGETLTLRVFVDHSVIEIFANDCFCLTTRVYPQGRDGLKVEPFFSGGAKLLEFQAWTMRSIWQPARIPEVAR